MGTERRGDGEVECLEDEDEEDGEVRLPSHFLKAVIATSGTGASAAQRRVQAGASESCAATDSPRRPAALAPRASRRRESGKVVHLVVCKVQCAKQ